MTQSRNDAVEVPQSLLCLAPQRVASRSGCIIEMPSEDARCLVVPMTVTDEVLLQHRYG